MPVSRRASFAARLLRWFDRHGRHDLPWQHPRSAYRVWVAEIMLQQTQVATVIPYFQRFIARFPDVGSLASAPLDDVLSLWSGLGYYARARNLHKAAGLIVQQRGGEIPRELEPLMDLPGIGRSTAGAILAQAHGQRHPILDGNVRRVLTRYAAIDGWPGEPAVANKLWALSESLLPRSRLTDYTQAIMDLGATVCTAKNPACPACPAHANCQAYAQGRTTEFPAPRPRRTRPLKRAHLLLIENSTGACLFERRPPAGIWGGLWCLPLVDESEDWKTQCRERYGVSVHRSHPLSAIRHGFSHFDLDLLPLRLKATATPQISEGAAHAWVTLDRALKYGMPAPVRKLLQGLPR